MNIATFNRTTYKLATVLALCLSLFYFTTLNPDQLSWVVPAAIAMLLIDMLVVNRFLNGFRDQYKHTCLDAEFTDYLRRKLKYRALYSMLKHDAFVVFYAFFAQQNP